MLIPRCLVRFSLLFTYPALFTPTAPRVDPGLYIASHQLVTDQPRQPNPSRLSRPTLFFRSSQSKSQGWGGQRLISNTNPAPVSTNLGTTCLGLHNEYQRSDSHLSQKHQRPPRADTFDTDCACLAQPKSLASADQRTCALSPPLTAKSSGIPFLDSPSRSRGQDGTTVIQWIDSNRVETINFFFSPVDAFAPTSPCRLSRAKGDQSNYPQCRKFELSCLGVVLRRCAASRSRPPSVAILLTIGLIPLSTSIEQNEQ
jgi:hypothetical protein